MSLTTFHIIHVIVGLWLIAVPLLRIFELNTAAAAWNNIIVGGVVAAYNAWFLFLKDNTDVKTKR
ncbi:MAG: hypothetical protein AB1492_08145 [Bacillota bacterium]